MVYRKFLLASLSLFGLNILTSCDENTLYDQVQSTGSQWARDDVKSFSFESKDTVGYYNIFIHIRAGKEYPYNNLFLIVKTFQPDGKAVADTLQYEMTDVAGNLLGNGLTDVKESALWFKSKYRFKKAGTYKFDIEHAVRKAGAQDGEQLLEGVYDVGMRIVKAK